VTYGRAVTFAELVDERDLVLALRRGDERAFAELVTRHTPGLLRVARAHVRDAGAAEDVVQETWLALLRGVDRFEQRSSLKTWLYRVALNRARSRGLRDARTAPNATVDPSRFRADDDPEWPGHWAVPPQPWQRDPQVQLQSAELLERLRVAINDLPARQREVVVLRDVQGLSTDEVAQVLELTTGNVRVLLHRGRATVRTRLEEYLS
jgi:RNA polymerase sigma-70 factor (ECF subfamily)